MSNVIAASSYAMYARAPIPIYMQVYTCICCAHRTHLAQTSHAMDTPRAAHAMPIYLSIPPSLYFSLSLSISLPLSLYIYTYIYIYIHTYVYVCVCTHTRSLSLVPSSYLAPRGNFTRRQLEGGAGSRKQLRAGPPALTPGVIIIIIIIMLIMINN